MQCLNPVAMQSLSHEELCLVGRDVVEDPHLKGD